MKPLSELRVDEASRLRAILFDLDDTVLTHGQLTMDAYQALWSLTQLRLPLVAVTGRGAGWGEVILRQWPIHAVVAENGAVHITRDPEHPHRLEKTTRDGLASRRPRLETIVSRLRDGSSWQGTAAIDGRLPSDVPLADDNGARLTDVTFDIGETWQAPRPILESLRDRARSLGARTTVSSVHLHVSLESDDKASGSLSLLGQLLGLDPATARGVAAYLGDSENDASAFACYSTSIGVANVAKALPRLTVPPRYVATEARGRGFAEIVSRLLALRGIHPVTAAGCCH